jgi:hypothetical protein
VVRVGIVGHRWFTDATSARFVAHQCERILRCGRDRHGHLVAVSAAAAGADTLFAEAALALDVPLELVRPFRGYLGDFSDAAARSRYRAILVAASSETRLRFPFRSQQAYEAAMRWTTERSDVLVAAWDGRPGRGRGGTAGAVRYAARIVRPYIHLDVYERVVRPHPALPWLT